MWSPQPSPDPTLCSQVIEKMEEVLKNKLQERSEPLPNRLQGRPSRGELLPQSSRPWSSSLPRASQFQELLPIVADGGTSLFIGPYTLFSQETHKMHQDIVREPG